MRFDSVRWLLLPAIAAHNLEEWLFAWNLSEDSNPMDSFAPISGPVLNAGLLIATLVPAALVTWASTGTQRRSKDGVVCWMASIFTTNAFFPHIALSILEIAYTPGLVTAVCFVVPVAICLLLSAYREIRLSRLELLSAFLFGVLTTPIAIYSTVKVAEVIAKVV